VANPWLALEIGADPARRVRELRRAHASFAADPAARLPVRSVVADSWRRSASARVDPDAIAPVDLGDGVVAYRDAHPLSAAMPVFRDLLGTVADDGEHVLAVCDAQGTLLWVEGHPGVLRQAESMNFVPGASWHERHAGTNAPGTALATDHAVQIFAAEHFSTAVQRWTCAAAPIHDPRDGRLLGAVDITGSDHLASPQSLALVQATARAAEAHLGGLLRPAPGAARPRAASGTARLEALGRDEALLVLRDRALRLGHRHSALVVLLAHRPDGLTGEQLGLELYGELDVQPVTLRAELSRLRHLLGPDLLDSRPYRLRAPVRTDFHEVLRALESGRVPAAVAGYRGPLLPGSQAPGIVRLRERLESMLRAAVLAGRDAALLDTWSRSPWGEEDLQVWEALLAASDAASPRRPQAAARIRVLRREYGLPPVP
jgi:hypothetical protein